MIRTLLKPLSFIPAILLMMMIYQFSAQPADVSKKNSLLFKFPDLILWNIYFNTSCILIIIIRYSFPLKIFCFNSKDLCFQTQDYIFYKKGA